MSETNGTATERGALNRLLSYIVLPPQISNFESGYLQRINRVALAFFLWHLPVFALIAYVNETGVALTLALTAITLAGPVLATRALRSPRALSLVYGFTAMCMGGILVHIGQGPVQIEMHFYFFSVLAMLALFGNPMVIIVAAATVSVHHLVLWYLLPSSVFNYDAPIWVVLVHATFVVLETVATCYIARNFFDNVIGLEKKVAERTAEIRKRNRDMKLVLDNVRLGFLTFDREGALSPEHSAIVDEWFGTYAEGERFWNLLARANETTATWFELGWAEVREGFMPLEVTLDQLPKSAVSGQQHFRMDYNPIKDETGELESLLIVISDVTAEVESNRAEAQRREILGVFERVLKDRTGFLEFYEEADRLVTSACGALASDLPLAKREIHTLKGNSGVFGLGSIAERCHAAEDRIAEGDLEGAQSELEALNEQWREFRTTVERLLGNHEQDTITMSGTEYDELLEEVVSGSDRVAIARRLAHLRLEPTEVRLNRLAEQAKALAERLEKGALEVEVGSHNLRVARERFSRFWNSLTHVVRNSIDHGLEAPSQRREAGKSETGHLALHTFEEGDEFVVEVRDDGRGIDWNAVRERAVALGVPIESDSDLAEALFVDGVSTKDEASEISGRGIGMNAVKCECESLGGRIEIRTEPGRGTTIQFRFPASILHEEPQLA
jgi:two-component system chemotaxis sensor kinase CheA